MNNAAIYIQANGKLAVLVPTPECLKHHNLEIIALKDVPSGSPFWIVESSELPDDLLFFDAWEIPDDYREPDGYGSMYNSFKEIEDASN